MSANVPTDIAALSPSEAPLATRFVLRVTSGGARGRTLAVQRLVRIGKAPDNDLVLPDSSVSRHHCEVEPGRAGLVVRDLGSTNHTRVGRTKIETATLEPGATLLLGDVELLVEAEVGGELPAPSASSSFGQAVGASLGMRRVFGVLERVAPTDAIVLLEGEAGTGKGVLAQAIHERSSRRGQPLICVDCTLVGDRRLEGELFGHESGAAGQTRPGAFEAAAGGTLFLDHVGELPLELQPKLSSVLEAGELMPAGGERALRCQARVVAATRRQLAAEVARGKLRADLYERLAAVTVVVPPLRERREDIPALVAAFLAEAHERAPAAGALELGPEGLACLAAHDWPGNVRELRGVLDRAVRLATATGESALRIAELPLRAVGGAQSGWGFEERESYRETRTRYEHEFEQRYVRWLLERHGGNVSAAARAARMDRKYLHELARRHGLRERG